MLQLVAFDLDGTLADFNRPIQLETVQLLQQLQKEEVKLIFTSGKPISYIAGVVRQSGLENIIIIGDNGGRIWFGHEFPPSKTIMMEMTAAASEELEKVKKAILTEFDKRVWIQPNEVAFSLFGNDIEIQKVYDFCDQVFKKEQIKHLKNFKTGGALDVMPLNIDKGVALKLIQEELNIPLEDTAVIGDGQNDIPMFLYGKIRITFAKTADIFKQFAPKVVKDINAALQFLIDLSQFEKNMILDSLM